MVFIRLDNTHICVSGVNCRIIAVVQVLISCPVLLCTEDGQRGGTRSAAGTQAEVPTLTSRVEGAGEEEEEEESSEREREQDKEESIKGDEGAHSVELPTSQEELRIRRLKHLDQ